MVCDERWKLIEYRVDGERHTQLFDLERDPHEIENLAGQSDQTSRIRSLRKSLKEWQGAVRDPVKVSES